MSLCCSRKRKLSARNVTAAACKHTFTDFLLPGSIRMVATLVFQADKQFHRSDNTLGVFRYQLWSRTINDSHGCVPACRSILMLTSRSSHACLKVLQPLSLKKVFPFLVAEKAHNCLSSMTISSGEFEAEYRLIFTLKFVVICFPPDVINERN